MTTEMIEHKIKSLVQIISEQDIKKIICIDDEWAKLLNEDIKPNLESEVHVNVGDDIFSEFIRLDVEREQIIDNAGFTSFQEVVDTLDSDEEYSDEEAEIFREIIDYFGGKIIRSLLLPEELTALKSICDDISDLLPDITVHFISDESGKTDIFGNEVDYAESIIFIDRLYNEGTVIDKEKLDNVTVLTADQAEVLEHNDKLVSRVIDIFENETGSSTNNIVIVYSYEGLMQIDSHSKRLAFLERKNIHDKDTKFYLLYKLDGLKKSGDKFEIANTLVDLINNVVFSNSIYNYIKSTEESFKSAIDDLIKIDKSKFNSDLDDSFIEGGCFVDYINSSIKNTYYDRFGQLITQNGAIINSIREFSKHEARHGAQIAEKIKRDEINYKNWLDNHREIKMINSTKNNSEHQVADFSVNEKYSNIDIGDLIQFKNPQHQELQTGIVISQQCDSVIRNPSLDSLANIPKRMTNNFDVLLLNGKEILVDSPDISKMVRKIFPIKIDDKYYQFTLPDRLNIIRLNCSVMDLCSLNSSGEAKYDNDLFIKALDFKNYHSRRYFQKYFSKWPDVMALLTSPFSETLNPAVKGMNKTDKAQWKRTFIQAQYKVEMDEFGFNLRRICRVNKNFTLLALQNYHNNEAAIGGEPTVASGC